jgi:excisionase family DNA binding protein
MDQLTPTAPPEDTGPSATLPEEVRAAIREEVEKALAEARVEQDRLISREEAARLLHVSTRTLDRLRRSGDVKAVMVGRRVLFDRAALGAYARKNVNRVNGRGEGSRR